MWGHPWVYAIVLPAISMISQILPVLCRRPLVGYTAVALATVMTMVLGFGVWLHHMFATGRDGGDLLLVSVPNIARRCGSECRLTMKRRSPQRIIAPSRLSSYGH